MNKIILLVFIFAPFACVSKKGAQKTSSPTISQQINDKTTCEAAGRTWDPNGKDCLTYQATCLAKNDGSIFQDETCLSLEEQCLREPGSDWNQGQCLYGREACEKNSGYNWINGSCVTQNQLCEILGSAFFVNPQNQCAPIDYITLCSENSSYPETIPIINLIAAQSKETSCADQKTWLMTQTKLTFPQGEIIDGLSHSMVISIAPLASAANLKSLEISNHFISDISPLMFLKQLTYLDLQNNQIENIDALSQLKQLDTLYLGYNQITDASPLTSLSKLTTLSLISNRLIDISPISQLTSLVTLYLNGNNFNNLSSLVSLTQLQEFSADDTPVANKKSEDVCPQDPTAPAGLRDYCLK